MLHNSLYRKKPEKPKVQMVAILRCFKLHCGPAKLSMISLMISAEIGVSLETGLLLIRLADSRILRQKSLSRGLLTGTKVCNHLTTERTGIRLLKAL